MLYGGVAQPKLTGDRGGKGEQQRVQQIVGAILQHHVLQERPTEGRVSAALQPLMEPECVCSRS